MKNARRSANSGGRYVSVLEGVDDSSGGIIAAVGLHRKRVAIISARFEILFSRAAPHSIDLKQLAAQSIDCYSLASPRRRSLMERLAGLPVRETVEGKQTHVTRPGTGHAEIAYALGGLEGPPFLAAMYSMALDGTKRPKLFASLREVASKMHRAEEWSERVPGVNGQPHHYGDELCGLVLDEDWLKPLFLAAPQLYWIYLDVPEKIWRAKLFGYFLRLKSRYESWLRIASGHVDRRISEELHRGPLDELAEAV